MKKEWKKVLSLVLALAMVLSICPFAFAEGEEVEEVTPVVQTVYDFAEFFETSDEFTGNPATDYDADGLTRVKNDNWTALSFWDGANKGLTDHNYTFRAGHGTRAWSDTSFTTLTLKDGATNSNVRIPNMVASYQTPGYTNTVATTALTDHWDGTDDVVYGDGGHASTTFWPYGGCIGYGFGTGAAYGNMSPYGRVQQAAVFTAPRAGFVTPEVRIYTKNNEKTAYRVYKNKVVDGAESWTNIYPAQGTGATITASYALDTHEANGWIIPGTGVTATSKDSVIWVDAGDQIILRIASTDGSNHSVPISLDTFKITYIEDIEAVYYQDTRTVDLRFDGAEDITYAVAEDSGLTATDVAGVFTVAEDFVDGTVVPVTVTVGTSTAIINAELTAVPTYDAAEAFYTTNDYSEGKTAAEKYATRSQTPANTNDGSDTWTVGYYEKNDIAGRLYLYPVLQRPTNYRAYEDTLYTGRNALMAWTISGAYVGSTTDWPSSYPTYAKPDTDGGQSIAVTNAGQGTLSYNFGSDTYVGTSGAGHNSYAGNTVTPTIIFTAPLDGVINPVLKAAASNANTVMYRMYKVDGAGNYTQIYPLATESANWVQPTSDWDGDYAISDVANNNWAYLPASSNNSWMIQNKGVVRVNKGDKIYLRFAGVAGSEAFALSQLTMNYLGRFGDDDELLLEAPFVDYQETYDLVTPRDSEIDLSVEILNPEAKGTMEYTITGNAEILRETADAGVYALTGKINAGGEAATVTAAYYSKGKSSANGDKPLYTTSTKVYVNAASMAVDTFSYDLFKASRLGYDGDGFLLPYYTNETERAMYGEIDLGLHADWAKAEVTISDETKVKYLGNGRIIAVGKHDFRDAGGTFPSKGGSNAPGLSAESYNGNPAVRSTETAGANPIVMTVKAPDGGLRKFNIWTFSTTVHGDTVSESYNFNMATYNTPTAVIAYEGYIDMDTNGGSFKPMYRDNGKHTQISPVSDDMYNHAQGSSYWYPRVPSFDGSANKFDFWMMNEKSWTALTNTPYVDYDGVAWAFTAPKTGTVTLSDHLTEVLYSNVPGWWIKDTVIGSVRKYATDGSYTELLKYTYNNYGAFDIVVPATEEGAENTIFAANASGNPKYNKVSAIEGTMANDINGDGSLDIPVKKGEVIRIILACNADEKGWISSFLKNSGDTGSVRYIPDPTFTYQYAEYPDEFGDGYFLEVNPTADGMTVENVFTFFYNEDGELLTVSTQAFEGSSEDGYFSIEVPSVNPAYAKVFFWDSLTNIRPLAGDIMVRK